jgi:putative endonuclease
MGIAGARGRAAEAMAASFLELMGLRVLARNVRLGGVEVDALAQEGSTRVVVEVKVRSRADFGGAAAAVDGSKRMRLLRAAAVLCARDPGPVRVDVVTIDLVREGAEVRHHRAAVESQGV